MRSSGTDESIDLTGVTPAPRGHRSGTGYALAYVFGRLELLAAGEPRELPPGVRELRDVVYSSPGGKDLHLDVYLPPAGTAPAPGILFVHGGFWSAGSKADERFYATRYASRGYVTASVQYRLSGEAHFPAPLRDVQEALRYLRSHAEELGMRSDAIAVVGRSAGAHLALLAAYAEGSGVSAVVDFYGPAVADGIVARHPAVRALMGTRYADSPELYEEASPVRQVRPGVPATLIFHGTIDGTVPPSQSESLFAALEAAGAEAYYDRVEGWPHGMDTEKRVNQHCVEVMDLFLDRSLGRED